MRFLPDGPNIPDELLVARDEGRVVFFCGSGVSKARAGLPDFYGLAETVLKKLGTSPTSPAYELFNLAKRLKDEGFDNLISADRIFGLLEKDFFSRQIENAVASALKPKKNVDLSAHKIILDLAKAGGKTKLITTNFDRLFDQCDANFTTYKPPRLPDIAKNEEFNGIVYLHGCSNIDYTSTDTTGFVLSSSEFGNAYLADGWATAFYKEIIQKYVVVFIGYSADDPPVQYLLEAINRKSGQFKDVYAFQVGDEVDAIARWSHKGIRAIPYKDGNEHNALWDSLCEWSERAKNPQHWYEAVLEKARLGPSSLRPHERGQIAHMLSNTEGAKIFAKSDPPPPAEWLCVFDYKKRLEKPGQTGSYDARELFIPFDHYGLDSDQIPDTSQENKLNTDTDPLNTPWDCFTLNSNDFKESNQSSYSSLNGGNALSPAPLLPRIQQIAIWLSKVSHQPCAVWWASYQAALHPEFLRLMHWHFKDRKDEQSKLVRRAWDYLETIWKRPEDIHGLGLYDLKNIVDTYGWDNNLVRKYIWLFEPRFQIGSEFWRGPKPPSPVVTDLREMVKLDVEYLKRNVEIDLPDEWLIVTIEQHRKNLELALQMENEIGDHGIGRFAPINEDETEDKSYTSHFRTHGLPGYIILFSKLFKRLIEFDPISAKQEFSKWSTTDTTVFCRLRIWVAGLPDFLNLDEFTKIMLQTSDEAFWGMSHQRDILISLKTRWNQLPVKLKKKLEKRLLKGSSERFKDESLKKVRERAAWGALTRINWLINQGCEFTFDTDEFNAKYLLRVPDWKPQYAKGAADSSLGRSGFVKTVSEYDVLLHIPISNILKTALENNGRTEDFLVQKDPFSGLCRDKPFRAFQALKYAATLKEFPVWAWSTFLSREFSDSKHTKFSYVIASRLLHYSDSDLSPILYYIVNWFVKFGQDLGANYPELFDKMFNKLIRLVKLPSPNTETAVVRGDTEIDWMSETINAPTGKLAELLYENAVFGKLEIAKGLPSNWRHYAEALLESEGDSRRYVLTALSYQIRWFYAVDPNWVEAHLISVLKSSCQDDVDAFWSGLFSGTRSHSIALYSRLKQEILSLAKPSSRINKSDFEVLASILLVGWLVVDSSTNERCFNSNELRETILGTNEEFKSSLLWQLKGWVKPENDSEELINLPEELVNFLQDVWPLQKSAKTPTISARLCDLAFSCRWNFPKMVEVILPLITPLQRHNHIYLNIDAEDSVFTKHPAEALALLYAALPSDISAWPYDSEKVLKKIEETAPQLASDERLVELFRIWNSR